jgi:hypothetical protein
MAKDFNLQSIIFTGYTNAVLGVTVLSEKKGIDVRMRDD